MKTRISLGSAEGFLSLCLRNDEDDYVLWRQALAGGSVFFEAGGQCVGGDDIARECTLMRDGLHVVVESGETVHFYFNAMPLDDYLGVVRALEKLYSARPALLEVLDA